jgi:hypothetical protein
MKTSKNKKPKPKREPSGYIYAEEKPAWLEWLVPEKFYDADLFRIVVFFVFHSPCIGSTTNPKPPSAMGKPVSKYGWSEKWGNYRNPKSLNHILRSASTNFTLIYSATGNNDMQQACKKAGLLTDFPTDVGLECAAISPSDQNQFLSLFRHIRNAFSHSRLNMRELSDGDLLFIFEDVAINKKPEGTPVSARIKLRKSTLLKWINIIEAGPQSGDTEDK